MQNVVQTRVPPEDIVTVEEAKKFGKEIWFAPLVFTKEEIQKMDLINKEGSDLQNSMTQRLQDSSSKKEGDGGRKVDQTRRN
ncbi:MAG: hypothetical protein ACYCQJ_03900 [Nitrososphaerales archaeon]